MATNTSDTDADDSWLHKETFPHRQNRNQIIVRTSLIDDDSCRVLPAAVDESSSTRIDVARRTTQPSSCNSSSAPQSFSDMPKKRIKCITASDEIRHTSTYSSRSGLSSKRSRSRRKKRKRRANLCAFPNDKDLQVEVTPQQGSRCRPGSFRRIPTGPSATSECFHERLTRDDNIDDIEPIVGCSEWRKVRPTRFNKQHIELLKKFILCGSLRQPEQPWRQIYILNVSINGELDITDGYSTDQESYECVSSQHVYVFPLLLEWKCVICAILKENDEERKALICDGCNYCVHPECAGVQIPITEDGPFFCRVCLEEQADNQRASPTLQCGEHIVEYV